MKRTSQFRLILLSATLLLAWPHSALGSFEPLPIGGRAAGMGEAYSAIADDVYSLYYNPAGILQLNRPEIGTYYSQLYPGLTDNSQISRMFVGYGQPLGQEGKWGGIGASYLALELSGLYKEESYGVTYGHDYEHIFNLGGSVKMLRRTIGSDAYTNNAIDPVSGTPLNAPDPLLAKGNSSTALGLDLGLQYRLTSTYALGLVGRNINSPNMALGPTSDVAPAVYSAALARQSRTGSLDVELMDWTDTASNLRISVGGEHWLSSGVGFRAGAALGSRNYATASFGFSYRMDTIQIDYATILPLEGIQGTYGLQQISLTVRLGKPPMDPMELQLIKEKQKRIEAETEARAAKAERDRLKKQLYDMTAAKTAAELEAERLAAQKTMEEAQSQLVVGARSGGKPSSDVDVLNRFAAALADYNAKVTRGLTLEEKKHILEGIYQDYAGQGVDTGLVTTELKNVIAEEVKANKDFELSMSFYHRLVEEGATLEDRRGMLERIIQKYGGTGININAAEEELQQLK